MSRREAAATPVRGPVEDPLQRLARVAPGETAPFLMPHHIAAAERVQRLAERAQLMPRVTMSYSAAHVAGGRRDPGEVSEMAAEARAALRRLYAVLPRDCAEVVLDVCALDKGLQQIEAEHCWPRRSGKLVLRIGLDRLAEHFGLSPEARGPVAGRSRGWMEGERLGMFG